MYTALSFVALQTSRGEKEMTIGKLSHNALTGMDSTVSVAWVEMMNLNYFAFNNEIR